MKCPTCGWIVRRDHGQLVPHPCVQPRPQRRKRAPRIADRETQEGRYLDAGPLAWDGWGRDEHDDPAGD